MNNFKFCPSQLPSNINDFENYVSLMLEVPKEIGQIRFCFDRSGGFNIYMKVGNYFCETITISVDNRYSRKDSEPLDYQFRKCQYGNGSLEDIIQYQVLISWGIDFIEWTRNAEWLGVANADSKEYHKRISSQYEEMDKLYQQKREQELKAKYKSKLRELSNLGYVQLTHNQAEVLVNDFKTQTVNNLLDVVQCSVHRHKNCLEYKDYIELTTANGRRFRHKTGKESSAISKADLVNLLTDKFVIVNNPELLK